MSVITQRGDHGETDLMFGRRVSKTHPRIVVNGSLDELNATLGLVRVFATEEPALRERMANLQQQLIQIMGEIATLPEDRQRYRDQFGILEVTRVTGLTEEAQKLESDLNARFRDWAIPGTHSPPACAYLDVARTICRRAERQLLELGSDAPETIAIYLNRLSDFLWILARKVERVI